MDCFIIESKFQDTANLRHNFELPPLDDSRIVLRIRRKNGKIEMMGTKF